MRLPIAVQTALERSEREFLSVLQHLGIDRKRLAQVAKRCRGVPKTAPKSKTAAREGRHV